MSRNPLDATGNCEPRDYQATPTQIDIQSIEAVDERDDCRTGIPEFIMMRDDEARLSNQGVKRSFRSHATYIV
jgi:hypothetical protein